MTAKAPSVAVPREPKCACGIPGRGNAHACHRLHYSGGETLDVGSLSATDRCRCSCHAVMCEDCEGESRTGTGQHGTAGEKCWCPCHKRGDGVPVPMPGYFTAGLGGVMSGCPAPAPDHHTVQREGQEPAWADDDEPDVQPEGRSTMPIGRAAPATPPEWAMEAGREIAAVEGWLRPEAPAKVARLIHAAYKASPDAGREERLENALRLILHPIREVAADEPHERSIPTHHQASDIRQARAALAEPQDGGGSRIDRREPRCDDQDCRCNGGEDR